MNQNFMKAPRDWCDPISFPISTNLDILIVIQELFFLPHHTGFVPLHCVQRWRRILRVLSNVAPISASSRGNDNPTRKSTWQTLEP